MIEIFFPEIFDQNQDKKSSKKMFKNLKISKFSPQLTPRTPNLLNPLQEEKFCKKF
jgi:hypothetical protein